jgi:hypothetical protein
MAYIKSRKQSDGTTRYTAVIRLRKGKVIVHLDGGRRVRLYSDEGHGVGLAA